MNERLKELFHYYKYKRRGSFKLPSSHQTPFWEEPEMAWGRLASGEAGRMFTLWVNFEGGASRTLELMDWVQGVGVGGVRADPAALN